MLIYDDMKQAEIDQILTLMKMLILFIIQKGINVTPQDVHLSYLPLAHMFERGMEVSVAIALQCTKVK